HDRARQREALLKQRVVELEGQLRLREQQLFGRKTEAGAAAAPTSPQTAPGPQPWRRRGQQPGRPGPRRRAYPHLPPAVEEHELPGEPCCCRACGPPFAPVSGPEDPPILEAAVRAP